MTAERELAILDALSPTAWRDLTTVYQACRLRVTSDTVGANLRTLVAAGLVRREQGWFGQCIYRLLPDGVARLNDLLAKRAAASEEASAGA